jgi:NAD(P)-dependent dehydrogenase (short-subunit alcohol dehydrogenase family)
MRDRTILITGATDGIGKQTALELAGLGAAVLLHGRDRAKGERVLAEIRAATGNKRLSLLIADLASLNQVRALAAEVRAACPRLDVLVNNAAVHIPQRQITEDGIETTFAVNHLAPFLLTNLLLDLLKASAPARIVNVSSDAHLGATIDFDNLQGERRYSGVDAYRLSKLGNVLFTFELAERLRGTGVTANCLHPGVIATKLLHGGWPQLRGDNLAAGALTTVYLATSSEIADISGRFFLNQRIAKASELADDVALRQRFWDVSAGLVGLLS